jgi:hypothetical protein
MHHNKNTWVNVIEHFSSLMLRKNKLTQLFLDLSVLKFVSNPRECHALQSTMEQHIFCILIDYRGHHKKGFAIYNAI